MTDTHWLHQMPCYDFNCLLIYYTPAGHRRNAHIKTRAIAADIALDIAEKLLRRDKRRHVGRIVYGEAIQQ